MLTEIQTRLLKFLIGCLGIRLLFVYLAKNLPLLGLQIIALRSTLKVSSQQVVQIRKLNDYSKLNLIYFSPPLREEKGG
jgi:hypothetical protein